MYKKKQCSEKMHTFLTIRDWQIICRRQLQVTFDSGRQILTYEISSFEAFPLNTSNRAGHKFSSHSNLLHYNPEPYWHNKLKGNIQIFLNVKNITAVNIALCWRKMIWTPSIIIFFSFHSKKNWNLIFFPPLKFGPKIRTNCNTETPEFTRPFSRMP